MWRNFIWGDVSRPIKRNTVNLYYYKFKRVDNVGDLLSFVVFNFIKNQYSLDDSRVKRTIRLFGIGSIIHAAKSDMVVWGSGVHDEDREVGPGVKLDIRAVRGPLTMKMVERYGYKCPNIFGDPALLLPLFYIPEKYEIQDFLIIPHYSKEDEIDFRYKGNMISTLTSDWKTFINRVANSRLVISGSLHGIIIAEAYGVPAILLSSIDKDMFKYRDYYYSTDRFDILIANSIDEAINMTKIMPPIPNLSTLQNNLLKSFPIDLWN
ncbi:pyruvyltransferase [Algoriphagus locisalis]|uniref:Pyruvyltransferase n=1 Tax=Algoriphagus locisalis TaxID=305507 RepID=A0A1I6Y496_9BACT|nr:polysaccharide pyruvyl transferase family protein [Algoriphagus locisalis]SFT45485.1 pyruvyltransferase [Algoriphagus locisalis]